MGRNPLIRISDRLESMSVLAVFVLALLAFPVAAQVENQIYDAGMRTVSEQTSSRHSVETVVIEGSTGMPADLGSPDYVRVEWRDGAQTHTERVVSPATVKAGAPLTIWLDQSGKVVSAPLTPSDAKFSAVATAWILWIAIVVLGALLAFFLRRRLDRSRSRAWERELLLLAHNDDGWANRHT